MFREGKIDEDTVDCPRLVAFKGASREDSSSSFNLGQLTKRIHGESDKFGEEEARQAQRKDRRIRAPFYLESPIGFTFTWNRPLCAVLMLLGGGGAQCVLPPPPRIWSTKSMIGIGLGWHLGLLRMYAVVVGLDDLFGILLGAVVIGAFHGLAVGNLVEYRTGRAQRIVKQSRYSLFCLYGGLNHKTLRFSFRSSLVVLTILRSARNWISAERPRVFRIAFVRYRAWEGAADNGRSGRKLTPPLKRKRNTIATATMRTSSKTSSCRRQRLVHKIIIKRTSGRPQVWSSIRSDQAGVQRPSDHPLARREGQQEASSSHAQMSSNSAQLTFLISFVIALVLCFLVF